MDLTNRQKEIIKWLSEGKTQREIGLILGISHKTVNAHIQMAARKLNLYGAISGSLVKWLVEQGEREISLTHKFQMNGHGTPDRPCVKCGLPDRHKIHQYEQQSN